MGDEETDLIYVHDLAKKIEGANVDNRWLASETGISSGLIYDWVRKDGKERKLVRVPADKVGKLALALRGRADWEEFIDPRPGLNPNSLDRHDTAAKFLARVKRETSAPAPRPRTPPSSEPLYLAIGKHPDKEIPPVKRDLADISHSASNAEPQSADKPFEISFKLCINVVEVGGSGFIGIRKVTLYVEFLDRNRAELRRAAAPPALTGVVTKLRGLDDKWLALDLKSDDAAPLSLDGAAQALRVGELVGASPGDSYRIRLEVDTDTGFCSEWPPEPVEIAPENETEEKRAARKKRKLIAQMRKWQKNIPADAVSIDLVDQKWLVVREAP